MRDNFIRPFLGDVFIVLLIFYFLNSFIDYEKGKLVLGVLGFAVIVEISQAFDLLAKSGLQDSQFAQIVLGSTFDWLDLLAYLIGSAAVYFVEDH